MEQLYVLDFKDYKEDWSESKRPSVRGIITREDKVLLVYSKKYNYYKFPGGGVEENESHEETLQREVLEECGLRVIPESIKEYGSVLVKQKSDCKENTVFVQENFYYTCETFEGSENQKLDAYEQEEGFTPVWMVPIEAVSINNKYIYFGEDVSIKKIVKRDNKILDGLDIVLRKKLRKKKEEEWIAGLGKTYYKEMLDYVENYLAISREFQDTKKAINYRRFDHIKRVLAWVMRLYEASEVKEKIDIDKVIIATIFHDVGRNEETDVVSHAQAGEIITRKYLLEKGFDKERTEKICELVAKHSDKYMMNDPKISPELLLLMEADLMDDMGALGVVMDCMIEEARNSDAYFADSLDHIARYTLRQQQRNPMVTTAAKKIWSEKKELVSNFYQSLSRDVELFK